MSIRNSLGRSPLVTLLVLGAFLWVLLAGFRIFDVLDLSNGGPVGQGAVSGIVGLVVIAIALVLLVAIFGEIGETEPGPEAWPPSE